MCCQKYSMTQITGMFSSFSTCGCVADGGEEDCPNGTVVVSGRRRLPSVRPQAVVQWWLTTAHLLPLAVCDRRLVPWNREWYRGGGGGGGGGYSGSESSNSGATRANS